MRRCTWRQVLIFCSPGSTLVLPQCEFQNATLSKETMRQPTLRPLFSIQRRALDVNILVAGIKIDTLYRRRLARVRVRDADFLEEWRNDEIDVLAAHGVQAHHGKSSEGAHGAGVIITGNTIQGIVERGGNVLVGVVGRQTRTSGEVEQEEKKIGLFVTHVQKSFRIVQVLQTLDKCLWSAEGRNEGCLVVRHIERVKPGTAFVCLVAVGVEVARREVVQECADRGILVAESAVQVAWHKESLETTVDKVVWIVTACEVEKRSAIRVKHVEPVA